MHLVQYYKYCSSTFSEGQGSPPPRLNASSAKKILRKSVVTLLAHIGYDSKLVQFVLFHVVCKIVIPYRLSNFKNIYFVYICTGSSPDCQDEREVRDRNTCCVPLQNSLLLKLHCYGSFRNSSAIIGNIF